MSVVEQVREYVDGLGATARKHPMSATALVLAASLDNPRNSATSKAMCSKALAEALGEVRAASAVDRPADRSDDLAAKRRELRARRSAS